MQNFEKICKEYSINVYKYLFCLTHSYDIAEELTQETMYKALNNINKLKYEDKIEYWLCKIAKNLWLQEVKKRKRNISFDDEKIIKNIQTEEDLLENVVIKEQTKQILEKVNKLDEVSKEVFKLRIIGNLKFKDIADIMGKTENWARVIFYRAKKQIMKEVDKDEQKTRM